MLHCVEDDPERESMVQNIIIIKIEMEIKMKIKINRKHMNDGMKQAGGLISE